MIANDFVTVYEAARTLGYTTQHTRLLVRQGKIQGIKTGRDWLLIRGSVMEFVMKRSTAPLLPSPRRGRPPSGRPYGIDFSHRDSVL